MTSRGRTTPARSETQLELPGSCEGTGSYVVVSGPCPSRRRSYRAFCSGDGMGPKRRAGTGAAAVAALVPFYGVYHWS